MKPAKVIAEIGCNHMGSLDIAKEMIDSAKYFCKAYAVKFQKRNLSECLTRQEYLSPHPVPQHSFGKTYGEHRKFLEFSLSEHKKLKRYCDSRSIIYSSSVWDLTSAKEIASLAPKFLKVPSACNTNFNILEYLCRDYKGEIHISLGMTTKKEEKEIINFMTQHKRLNDTVLYACTASYPVIDSDVCLLEIERLIRNYGKKVRAIGFSGHHKGIAIDIAAVVLGAQYIERHFTLDRTQKGTDHAASVEPDGMRRIVRDIESVARSMRYKNKDILDVEMEQRRKLKWNRPKNIQP